MKFLSLLLIVLAVEWSCAQISEMDQLTEYKDSQDSEVRPPITNEQQLMEEMTNVEETENEIREGDNNEEYDEEDDVAAVATHNIHHLFKKCFGLRQCRARACQPCYQQCLIVSCVQGRCRILCSKMCHKYKHCLNKRRHCAYKYLRNGCRRLYRKRLLHKRGLPFKQGLPYKPYW